jgi:hypothetical protein
MSTPRSERSDEFCVRITRHKRPKTHIRRAKFFWSWAIARRSQPLSPKLCGDGFTSEAAAKLAGEKALMAFLQRPHDQQRAARTPEYNDIAAPSVDGSASAQPAA